MIKTPERYKGVLESRKRVIEPKPPSLTLKLVFAYAALLASLALILAFLFEHKH